MRPVRRVMFGIGVSSERIETALTCRARLDVRIEVGTGSLLETSFEKQLQFFIRWTGLDRFESGDSVVSVVRCTSGVERPHTFTIETRRIYDSMPK